jgi:hypothetical protein
MPATNSSNGGVSPAATKTMPCQICTRSSGRRIDDGSKSSAPAISGALRRTPSSP